MTRLWGKWRGNEKQVQLPHNHLLPWSQDSPLTQAQRLNMVFVNAWVHWGGVLTVITNREMSSLSGLCVGMKWNMTNDCSSPFNYVCRCNETRLHNGEFDPNVCGRAGPCGSLGHTGWIGTAIGLQTRKTGQIFLNRAGVNRNVRHNGPLDKPLPATR